MNIWERIILEVQGAAGGFNYVGQGSFAGLPHLDSNFETQDTDTPFPYDRAQGMNADTNSSDNVTALAGHQRGRGRPNVSGQYTPSKAYLVTHQNEAAGTNISPNWQGGTSVLMPRGARDAGPVLDKYGRPVSPQYIPDKVKGNVGPADQWDAGVIPGLHPSPTLGDDNDPEIAKWKPPEEDKMWESAEAMNFDPFEEVEQHVIHRLMEMGVSEGVIAQRWEDIRQYMEQSTHVMTPDKMALEIYRDMLAYDDFDRYSGDSSRVPLFTGNERLVAEESVYEAQTKELDDEILGNQSTGGWDKFAEKVWQDEVKHELRAMGLDSIHLAQWYELINRLSTHNRKDINDLISPQRAAKIVFDFAKRGTIPPGYGSKHAPSVVPLYTGNKRLVAEDIKMNLYEFFDPETPPTEEVENPEQTHEKDQTDDEVENKMDKIYGQEDNHDFDGGKESNDDSTQMTSGEDENPFGMKGDPSEPDAEEGAEMVKQQSDHLDASGVIMLDDEPAGIVSLGGDGAPGGEESPPGEQDAQDFQLTVEPEVGMMPSLSQMMDPQDTLVGQGGPAGLAAMPQMAQNLLPKKDSSWDEMAIQVGDAIINLRKNPQIPQVPQVGGFPPTPVGGDAVPMMEAVNRLWKDMSSSKTKKKK